MKNFKISVNARHFLLITAAAIALSMAVPATNDMSNKGRGGTGLAKHDAG